MHLPPLRSEEGSSGLIDAADGDLTLTPTSAAVDYCDASAYVPLQPDSQRQPRGYDHEANANGSPGTAGGTYDLGADEVWWFFADGFETGDTSAWASQSP